MKKVAKSKSTGRIKRVAKKNGTSRNTKRPRTLGQEFVERVMNHFRRNAREVYNYRQVAKAVGAVTTPEKQLITQILEAFTQNEILQEVERGRYRFKSTGTLIVGTFERHRYGNNSVTPDDGSAEILIAPTNSMRAMQGDIVEVQLFARRKGRTREGEVVSILQRKRETFVGKLKINGSTGFVFIDEREVNNGISVSKSSLQGAKDGDKVVVRISEWPDIAKNPVGEIVENLGPAGDNDVEMHAILAEFNLPYSYPEEAEEAARQIPAGIPSEEYRQREDFREVLTLTIDPADAKDFDDALSWQQLSDGNFEVGVHIADVSFYVTPKDIIDREAYQRATSVYLVDRTIPMLPERLCNDLCSLRPNEERLAYSCIFRLSPQAEVLQYRIARTIIRSDRRYAYEEAQQVIDTGEGDNAEAILSLHQLATGLRERRFRGGAINFNGEEVRFVLDEKGHPIDVKPVVHGTANDLIEEFMLLANRTVAKEIATRHRNPQGEAKTFLYRVHDDPNPDKISLLSNFVERLNYIPTKSKANEPTRKRISSIVEYFAKRPEAPIVQIMLVRAMARAEYSTVNIGHYGLALEYYTHFTSPIRRYPDLLVHRLLTRYLAGGASVDNGEYEEMAQHSSKQEQLAAKAERESIKYKQVEYMSLRLGKVFAGIISSVTEWGIYVELEGSHCEGLIPMRLMDDDFYEYDEKTLSLVGRRYKRTFALGDTINVRVISTDLDRRQLTFEIAE